MTLRGGGGTWGCRLNTHFYQNIPWLFHDVALPHDNTALIIFNKTEFPSPDLVLLNHVNDTSNKNNNNKHQSNEITAILGSSGSWAILLYSSTNCYMHIFVANLFWVWGLVCTFMQDQQQQWRRSHQDSEHKHSTGSRMWLIDWLTDSF